MRNIWKLKAIQQIAGIIAMIAVIGFSMTACDSGSGGGGDITVMVKNNYKYDIERVFVTKA